MHSFLMHFYVLPTTFTPLFFFFSQTDFYFSLSTAKAETRPGHPEPGAQSVGVNRGTHALREHARVLLEQS